MAAGLTTPGRAGDWPAWSGDVMEMLGLPRNGHLPKEAMPERQIQGFRVWVNSVETARERGQFHRIRVECPKCGQDVPFGRMRQHDKIHR